MACHYSACCNFDRGGLNDYHDGITSSKCWDTATCDGSSYNFHDGCYNINNGCAYCAGDDAPYSNNVCNINCSLVPELPPQSTAYFGLILVLVACVVGIRHWVKSKRRGVNFSELLFARLGNSLVAASCAALAVVVEYVVLRVYVRSLLQIKLGFPTGTDYDFVPHSMIALFFLARWIGQKEPKAFKLQRSMLIAHTLLLISFALITFLFKGFVSYSHPLFMVSWFSLAAVTLASVFFVWFPISFFANHVRARILVPIALLGSSGLISQTLFALLWEPVAHLTGIVVYQVVHGILPTISYKLTYVVTATRVDEYTLLEHPLHAISIGRGCGGMEGISIFVFLLGLFIVSKNTPFRFFRSAMVCTVGIFYMFFLNAFRLAFFFLIILRAEMTWEKSPSLKLATALFHNSLGWILYGLGLWLFFSVLSRVRNFDVRRFITRLLPRSGRLENT